MIFQKSINQGTVSSALLTANVSPIFKKGSRAYPANYRPVSLTSVPCKILEKILRLNITNHFNQNKLIRPEQHGFVERKSCSTYLLETLDFATKALADKSALDIVFLDFSKDKVSHRLLLLKLENYGITGNVLSLIHSFLNKRTQRMS